MSVTIEMVAHSELDSLIPQLATLLMETVNRDVPLGFMAPITLEESTQYWHTLKGDLRSGTRMLLVALDEGRVVGAGQLALTSVPNRCHSCEIQKLFVNTAIRGKGIGRALMDELHAEARRMGRPLVVLQTRKGVPAEGFYRQMGYAVGGVVPGYTIDREGRRYDTVTFYRELKAES